MSSIDKPKTSSGGGSWSETSDYFDRHFAPGTIKAAEAMFKATLELRPVDSDSRVLDVGAGPGALTISVRKQYPEVPIVAVDIAPGMVELLARKGIPGVTTGQADGTDLDRSLVPDESFTHATAPMMIQFCGEKQINVMSELFRALVPRGVGAASITRDINVSEPWDRACEMLDPEYPKHKMETHNEKAWIELGQLEAGMKEVGFVEVRSFMLWADFKFDSTAEYLDFWFNGKHPGFERNISGWKGDRDEVRPMMEKVLREQYPDPPRFGCNMGIVVGRKP